MRLGGLKEIFQFFCLHFSVIRRGSHGIFMLCTASSRCTRIDAAKRHVVQYQLLSSLNIGEGGGC